MKNIRLRKECYRGKVLCFVTICFEERKPVALNRDIALWIVERLRWPAVDKGILVHAYCLMADHLHVLGEGLSVEGDFLRFIIDFKQETGFAFVWRWRQKLWEKRFYDHILRDSGEFERVAWYVWLNAVRRGICVAASEYAWSGAMSEAGTLLLGKHRPVDWVPPWKSRGEFSSDKPEFMDGEQR